MFDMPRVKCQLSGAQFPPLPTSQVIIKSILARMAPIGLGILLKYISKKILKTLNCQHTLADSEAKTGAHQVSTSYHQFITTAHQVINDDH